MSNIINYIFDILNQNIYFKLLGIISFIFGIYEIVKFICNKISEQIVLTILQRLSKKCLIKSRSGIIEIKNLKEFYPNKKGFDFILKYKDGKISDTQVYIPKIKIGDAVKMTILSIYRYEKLVKQELNGKRDVHCHVCSSNGDDFYLTSKREFKVINYNIEK
jgi:hypothetical protein